MVRHLALIYTKKPRGHSFTSWSCDNVAVYDVKVEKFYTLRYFPRRMFPSQGQMQEVEV